ncbi:MAG: SEL1-like repeat protein [Synergistaceae bacterium]|nr:SEL1-like repeat protein [Synergistaceae bacterium]MBQ3399029.1 SEL1-like repeat protein [Synergistaceae bacterium]MBQ6115533.1 SEL1-like repeat protein [Synergistaceae bacterium]MBQ6418674.1 SEL1-like repeat protein [Synergistaceae bacterium]MBQ6981866.1 SEL1-like repeat protein [Synergistaceae bacterium]
MRKTSRYILLADMYNYGWGVQKDVEQAMKYYTMAGKNGEYTRSSCILTLCWAVKITHRRKN